LPDITVALDIPMQRSGGPVAGRYSEFMIAMANRKPSSASKFMTARASFPLQSETWIIELVEIAGA